jgi:hypothetical protein
MRVSELIEKLSTCDGDSEVEIGPRERKFPFRYKITHVEEETMYVTKRVILR